MHTSLHYTPAAHVERTLHLVDLENLTRGPTAGREIALGIFSRYLEEARWAQGHHLILASSGLLMSEVVFDLDSFPASLHVADGPDGADQLLLDLAPEALVTARYERLVIGSGDGIFSDRACALRRCGVSVEVVAPRGCCSRRLTSFHPRLIDCTGLALAA